MKKLALIAIVVVSASLFGTEVNAQVKNRVGFFLAAASGDIDMVGLGGVGEFRAMDKLTIAPQLIFYFPEERGNADVKFFELNVNANYYFYNHDILEFYGLAGLNYSRVKVDYDGGGDASDGEMGLNLGAGLNFEIGQKFIPFTELRITLGEYDQFVFNAGLKFNLN
jgi:outer membrane immunogenic protein